MVEFWSRLDELVAAHRIAIDRPKGALHPRYPEIVYPLDYGYLENTASGDAKEIDVWRGSMAPGLLVGVICTVDVLKRDTEIKLLLGCTASEIDIVKEFHNNSGSMSGLVVMRSDE